MTRKFSSISVETTLASGINSSQTSITVATGSGTTLLGGVSLAAGNVDQFTVAIDPDTTNEEILFITAVSSDTFTVVRGRAGTTAVSHSAGATVRHVLTSDDLNAFTTAISPVTNVQFAGSSTGSTTVQAGATASGTLTLPAATDTLVGRNTTDTLTNKTLSSPIVTGTITAGGATGTNGQVLTSTGTGVSWSNASSGTVTSITAGTGLSGGTITSSGTIAIDSTVATLTGSQTLTNKTIDFNSNTITNLPASMTLLSTNTISSGVSTVTVSSISGSYRNLMIDIEAVTTGNGVVYLWLDSSNSGSSAQCVFTYAAGSGAASSAADGDRIVLAPTGPQTTGGQTNKWVINIYNYTTSQSFTYSGRLGKTTNQVGIFGGGAGKGASYSAITLEVIGTTFSSGTIKIYGVN